MARFSRLVTVSIRCGSDRPRRSRKKQYRKLLAPLTFEVEYIYILNDWFRKPEYKDVLDYVVSVGCQFYFLYLLLQKLGLPVPKEASNYPTMLAA